MKFGAGRCLFSLSLCVLIVGCGKKGPPLPPLVRLPVAPPDFTAVRRGPSVAIQFVVPAGNNDGSTPADIARVEVYALTGLPTATPDEIIKRGKRVATVQVNRPRDPDETPEQTKRREAARLTDALDQGVTARLSEALAFDVSADVSEVRSYLAVAFNRRGRRGPFSTRVLVPLISPPAAPSAPAVSWDEKAITVGWAPPDPTPSADVAYNVYVAGEVEARLTDMPVTDLFLVDSHLEWGTERCYLVRTAVVAENMSLESEASPPTCVTPTDIFEPARPQGLTTVAGDGTINLIWNPNNESDLAGYLVYRAIAPSENLVAVTPAPVVETTFSDSVPSGARVTYAIRAVDKAGNASALSERVPDTAR